MKRHYTDSSRDKDLSTKKRAAKSPAINLTERFASILSRPLDARDQTLAKYLTEVFQNDLNQYLFYLRVEYLFSGIAGKDRNYDGSRRFWSDVPSSPWMMWLYLAQWAKSLATAPSNMVPTDLWLASLEESWLDSSADSLFVRMPNIAEEVRFVAGDVRVRQRAIEAQNIRARFVRLLGKLPDGQSPLPKRRWLGIQWTGERFDLVERTEHGIAMRVLHRRLEEISRYSIGVDWGSECIIGALQTRAALGRNNTAFGKLCPDLDILADLLASSEKQSHVLTADGTPFVQEHEPLQWNISPISEATDSPGILPSLATSAVKPARHTTPPHVTAPRAENTDDLKTTDYAATLCCVDGTPVAPDSIVAVVPGHGIYYYFTATTWRTGPAHPFLPHLVDGDIHDFGLLTKVPDHIPHQVIVPGEALVSREGLRLLSRIEAQLPPKLQSKIVRITWQAALTCSLSPLSESLEDSADARRPGANREIILHAKWKSPDLPIQAWAIGSAHIGGLRPEELNLLDDVVEDQRFRGGAELVDAIVALGAKPTAISGEWRKKCSAQFPADLLEWIAVVRQHCDVELDPALQEIIDSDISAEISLKISPSGIDWFNIELNRSPHTQRFSSNELTLLLRSHGQFVKIPGKGWVRFTALLTPAERSLLDSLGLRLEDLSGKPTRIHSLQLAEVRQNHLQLLTATHDQLSTIANQWVPQQAQISMVNSPLLEKTLRPYQREGVEFLLRLASYNMGGILADDMGLGKTIQVLAFLSSLRKAHVNPPPITTPHAQSETRSSGTNIEPALVICPKSLRDNWVSEAQKYTPELRIAAYDRGSKLSLRQQIKDLDILLVTYPVLRIAREALSTVHWRCLVLDEGQTIKNPASTVTKSARSLHAQCRFILSGTPLENRVLDLFSQLDLCVPGILGSLADFQERVKGEISSTELHRLKILTRPFMLRRTKQQVAPELPTRTEIDIACEMGSEQRSLYDAELKRAQAMLLKADTHKELQKLRFHVFSSLTRLRQICCHPALVDDSNKTAESGKLTRLMDMLQSLRDEGHRVLVFSQFVGMLSIIRRACIAEGWNPMYMDGQTEQRGMLVQRFQSSCPGTLFLISLKTGGTGLNLTAASYVILVDPWWNPAVENQAIDRVHRIGQELPVTAYRMIAKNSIEERVRELQRKKADLFAMVVDEKRFTTSATLEDLRSLLSVTEAEIIESTSKRKISHR